MYVYAKYVTWDECLVFLQELKCPEIDTFAEIFNKKME